jgi:hypothetical protein
VGDWRERGGVAAGLAAVITAVTCTGDRPMPFGLCVEYMANQTRRPDEWIIVDDGRVPLTQSAQRLQEYCEIPNVKIVRRLAQRYDPPHTLCVNLLEALEHVSNTSIVFIEDDDWYSPRHIELIDEGLQAADLVGFQGIVYYHVGRRCYRAMGETSPHASLCQTGITANAGQTLSRICASQDTGFFVDLRLWREFAGNINLQKNMGTVVGIKGLPGRPGLTAGWRSSNGYTPDRELKYLESLIGEDVRNYILPDSRGPSDTVVRQPNSSGGIVA